MMRTVLLIITLVFFVNGLLQADPPVEDSRPDSVQALPQQEKAAETARKKPAGPAPFFTPSEKISADSAVSFPVDI
jgi:hypothetical protein